MHAALESMEPSPQGQVATLAGQLQGGELRHLDESAKPALEIGE